MNTHSDFQNKNIISRIGNDAIVDDVIQRFFEHMHEDYHINRYFNNSDISEKTTAFKNLLTVAETSSDNSETIKAALDDFFMHLFARSKDKTLIQASDFGFFGLIIEQDHPSTKFLCDMHVHLLKFMPKDVHFDAVKQHLQDALQEAGVSASLAKDVLVVAESARDPLLGK